MVFFGDDSELGVRRRLLVPLSVIDEAVAFIKVGSILGLHLRSRFSEVGKVECTSLTLDRTAELTALPAHVRWDTSAMVSLSEVGSQPGCWC
jgi:hypothetical protein